MERERRKLVKLKWAILRDGPTKANVAAVDRYVDDAASMADYD